MSIKILTYVDTTYMVRAERIVDLYNQESSSPFDENLSLANPGSTCIILSDNDSAGVLLDHHPNDNVWRVMFAAFDPDNRGRGLLKDCLAYAETQGIDIALVEINGSDEAHIWKRLGYTFFGSMGMCMTLSNRQLNFINYNAVMA